MIDESNDTRSKILDAAVHVFAAKGYHETRVDDIVAESKTSKGSIYFYFPSKQDIFFGLIETFSSLLEKRMTDAIKTEEHGIQQLDAALKVSFKLFSQYRTLAKIVLVQAVGLGADFETKRRIINDRFARIIQQRLDEAILDHSIPDVRTELVARAWVGALNEVVINWIYSGNDDLDENIPALRELLLRSIGVTKDQFPSNNT